MLIFAFSSKAQEAIIVRGYLESPNTRASINMQKNMFCYLNGDFVISKYYDDFSTFKVDSVISGSLLNFKNEINKPPFNIKIALINECTILNYRQNYTLRIKQFPYTNYYYIDSLSQVFSNEKYSDKLVEYYKKYQENNNLLTKGTLQERHDFLDKIQQNNYTTQYSDYRYITYIFPLMSSRDTIINYGIFHWDGVNVETGQKVGGSEIYEEKGLLPDYLYNYLDRTLPFVLPDKTTDSICWHNWFDSIRCSQEFLPVKYIENEHKTIKSTNDEWFGYFISDMLNRKIYFDFRNKACVLNMNTDEIEEKQKPRNCNSPYCGDNYSIQNYEIPTYNSFNKGIDLSKLENGVFCRQDYKMIPLNLQYKETPSVSYPNLIIHSDMDFLIFTSQNPDGYNCLKVGKINRKGKWIIEPEILYQKPLKSYVGDTDDIRAFSFFQSNENETTFVFSDRSFGRNSYSANEKYTDAIIIYKLNSNLEVQDTVIFTMDFPRFDYSFSKTNLLKKDSTYLLLAQTSSNSNYQLYYRLLNNDLTPKTDFLKFANRLQDYNAVSKPIVTTEGFMISWIDNDVAEGILRSVLIDKLGKQSEIINISNQRIDNIYNVEFDENNVDIYLFSRDEQTLIRKRINKKEYK